MAHRNLITIGGLPGSGKSTVRNIVAKTLGYETFSTGDMVRALASERGVTLEELNKESARNKEVDLLIDGKLMDVERDSERMVIDSILGYHFVPSAFHVFLDITPEESAQRIFNDRMKSTRIESGDTYTDLEETRAHIKRRVENHQARYKEHYGIDPYDRTQYDLVIDTSVTTPEGVAAQILAAYEIWQRK